LEGKKLIKFLLFALWFTLFSLSCKNLSASHGLSMKGDYEMSKEHANLHSYLGIWVTADGYIRHELLPNGRYDEARGDRKSAYQGNYTIKGNHIEYVDDTGFTADGDFINGVLYHAGMVLYLEEHSEGSK
jgi:Agrobacterium tumefaciens protein Atu4866